MEAPKIRSVRALKDKRLLVEFVEGTKRTYDCTQLLLMERFQPLRNEAFFRSVRLDPGGTAFHGTTTRT